MPGSARAGKNWLPMWMHLQRATPGACTRCMGTYGNGAQAGMAATSRLVVSGAARSTTFRSTAVPRSATGAVRRTPTTTLVFVFRGPRAISEPPFCPSSLCSANFESIVFLRRFITISRRALVPVQKLLRAFGVFSVFRPKGPAIQIARANGPGIENNQTLKAQRADSSIPNDGP